MMQYQKFNLTTHKYKLQNYKNSAESLTERQQSRDVEISSQGIIYKEIDTKGGYSAPAGVIFYFSWTEK